MERVIRFKKEKCLLGLLRRFKGIPDWGERHPNILRGGHFAVEFRFILLRNRGK